MADFAKSLPYILHHEGGYVNNPHDKGGPTNFGITLSTLSLWRHKPATALDVRDMKVAEAGEIYRMHYWDALRLDGISDQNIATALFDVGVNRGVGTARQYAHWICGKLGYEQVNDCGRHIFISMLSEHLRESYDHIVAAHPSQAVFIRGWHNRADQLKQLA